VLVLEYLVLGAASVCACIADGCIHPSCIMHASSRRTMQDGHTVARSLRQMGVKAFVFGVTGNALEEVRQAVLCLLTIAPVSCPAPLHLSQCPIIVPSPRS
jgi:hypothetical protein